MEKMARRAMLFDYYGGLLNEKQKSIYEDTVTQDMSLSEIGDAEGITRQAVSEIIKRCDEKLERYERDLGLIRKAEIIEKSIVQINPVASKLEENDRRCIADATESIIKEL